MDHISYMVQEKNPKGYRAFLANNPTEERRIASYSAILNPDDSAPFLVVMEEGKAMSLSDIVDNFCQQYNLLDLDEDYRDDILYLSLAYGWPPCFSKGKHLYEAGVITKVKLPEKKYGHTLCILTDFGNDVAKPLSMRGTKLVNSLLERREPQFVEKLTERVRRSPTRNKPWPIGEHVFYCTLRSVLPKSAHGLDYKLAFLELVRLLYDNQDEVIDKRKIEKSLPSFTYTRIDKILKNMDDNGMVEVQDRWIRVEPLLAILYETVLQPWEKLMLRAEKMISEDEEGLYIFRDKLKESNEYKTFANVYNNMSDIERYKIDVLRHWWLTLCPYRKPLENI